MKNNNKVWVILFLMLSVCVNAQHEISQSVDLFQPGVQEINLIEADDFDEGELISRESFFENPFSAPATNRPFITVWQTDNAGVTGDDRIRIPVSGTYHYTWEEVDNPDNNGSRINVNGVANIKFPHPGKYRVKITPKTFIRFAFNNGGDKYKLIDIEQWGDIVWNSMEGAFYGANNLNVSASDAPNLSIVTSMSSMFRSCTSFNSDINHWDVSNVKDMSYMFSSAFNFNKPLDNWNVDNLTDMSYMFRNALRFNHSLNNWNVSNVTNMEHAFYNAQSFNQPLDNWDVSGVIHFHWMFGRAISFNQSLGDWFFLSWIGAVNMLTDSGLSCSNYSKTIIGWSENPDLPNNINFGANGRYYGSDALVARHILTETKGWNIIGDEYDGNCVLDDCTDIIVHSGSIASGTYQTNEKIESTGQLSGNTYYYAGRSILLDDGFKVDGGAVFEARIKGCDD